MHHNSDIHLPIPTDFPNLVAVIVLVLDFQTPVGEAEKREGVSNARSDHESEMADIQGKASIMKELYR